MINGFSCGFWQEPFGLTQIWQQVKKIRTDFRTRHIFGNQIHKCGKSMIVENRLLEDLILSVGSCDLFYWNF